MDEANFKFSSFVIDGRRGIRQLLERRYKLPVQMCQFHQLQIIKRYLSSRPKLQASKELKEIISKLTDTDEISLKLQLEKWHNKWNSFISEKTVDINSNKWHYTHSKVCSAYRSISNNLPYLFTFKRYPDLNIPNTTNSCDSSFGHWKKKIEIHRGLRIKNKKKMINYLLENS